jgi:hypothetical protein
MRLAFSDLTLPAFDHLARVAPPPQAVDPGLSIDAGLATIGDIAATLAGPGSALESLRRVVALLAGIGLTDAGIALVEGGRPATSSAIIATANMIAPMRAAPAWSPSG